MPAVSVIMGVYNCKNEILLEKSIHSIIQQSYTDWEFLICDDGSTDGKTLNLLKTYEAEDPRIRILSYEKNQGLSYALNTCTGEATGKYIVRQDDDDVSKPERFQKLVSFAEAVAKETRRCEDYDLFMRMYAAGYKGYNLQEKLYEYRVLRGDKKYRPMKDRIDEAIVRYKGFKQMGILICGIPYVVKPILIGLIPQRIFRRIKQIQFNR